MMGILSSISDIRNLWRNVSAVLALVLILTVALASWYRKDGRNDSRDAQVLVLDAIHETTLAVEESERRLSEQLTVTGERLHLRHDELAETVKELRKWVREYDESRRAAREATRKANDFE